MSRHQSTPIIDGRKACLNCGQIKPLTDFYKNPKNGNGYFTCCKECTAIKRGQKYEPPQPRQPAVYSPSFGAIQLPLDKGYITLIDTIDKDLTQLKWFASRAQKADLVYARRTPYKDGKRQCVVSLHRVIMERMLNRPLAPKEEVDHINGYGLDNRRKNLRVATRSQNQSNAKLRKDNTSGYKGVGFSKRHGKWTARIYIDGKRVTLGYYSTPEEAYQAYCNAAYKHRGEFARTE